MFYVSMEDFGGVYWDSLKGEPLALLICTQKNKKNKQGGVGRGNSDQLSAHFDI